MARALWSGAISFGLVNVPVKLYRATSSAGHGISFHQIHAACGTRIQHVRRCPHCEREVPWEEVAKGYEFQKGRYAVLTDEDFAGLPREDAAAIAIEEFVEEREIDPIYYDTSYYVAPDGPPRAYALLHDALHKSGRVAVARMMLRTRGHLCVVRAAPERLILETMHYAAEMVKAEDVPGVPPKLTATPREIEMATRLIEAMATPFEIEKYRDTYSDAVRAVIEKKIEGHEVVEPTPLAGRPEVGQVIDLMEALKRSVASVRETEAAARPRPAKSKREAQASAEKAAPPAQRSAASKKKPAAGRRAAGGGQKAS